VLLQHPGDLTQLIGHSRRSGHRFCELAFERAHLCHPSLVAMHIAGDVVEPVLDAARVAVHIR